MIKHIQSVLLITLLVIIGLTSSFAFAENAPKEQSSAPTIKTEAVRKVIPALSVSECKKLNLTKPSNVTAKQLSRASNYSGLKGLYDNFVRAEKKYGVNAVFLMSVSIVESSGGKHMFRENNMFGYGGKDFDSKAECISTVAKGLKKNYLSPSGNYYKGKTVTAVNKYYCTSTSWSNKVASQMSRIYKDINNQ